MLDDLVQELLRSHHHSEALTGKWFAALEEADIRSIIAVIGNLGAVATGSTPTQIAYREAARSMVELKLTDRMIEKMDSLERQAARLQWAAIGAGVVIGLLTIVIGVVSI
jgi:hypothetical protein